MEHFVRTVSVSDLIQFPAVSHLKVIPTIAALVQKLAADMRQLETINGFFF